MKRVGVVSALVMSFLILLLPVARQASAISMRSRVNLRALRAEQARARARNAAKARNAANKQKKSSSSWSSSELHAIYAVDNYLEGILLEVKVSDDTFSKVRPAFQTAWDARNQASQTFKANHDRKALLKSLNSLNSKLESALKANLTDTEMVALNNFVATGAAVHQQNTDGTSQNSSSGAVDNRVYGEPIPADKPAANTAK